MTTKATPNTHDITRAATLLVALELREKTWKLGFTTGHGQKPREWSMPARNQEERSRIHRGRKRGAEA